MALKPRSLATVLSKLDRDVDLSWLEDRPDVQLALARRLGCSVDAVSAHVAPTTPTAATRQLSWRDLRYARPLDLLREPLPPGIPEQVLDASTWQKLWWVAPSGAGRSLVGQWLSARGRARHLRVPDLASAAAALEEDELPVFVEVEAVTSSGGLPERRRACVAAAFAPPSNDWLVVESPAVGEICDAVVRWTAERLPKDSDFDQDRVLAWLEPPLRDGEIDGLGSLLGICGAFDELGMRETKNARALDLGLRFARRRIDETFGSGSPEMAWLRRNVLDVLVGMARRTLTDEDEPLVCSRSLDEWIALVPEQHRSGLEVEWLRLSLSRVDSSIRPVDIERAARRMSPGAFRVIRALEAARLLVPVGSMGELVLSPRWLASAVNREARRALLSASPFEWGEGLLRPHAAGEIARDLLFRIGQGDTTALSDVVELESEESADYAAALEAAFRCAGIALLSGADVDQELLDAIWEEQTELQLQLPGAPPLPRIEHRASDSALLSRGAWYLAALAISERLQAASRLSPSVLCPWNAESVPPELGTVLDAIASTARAARSRGQRFGLEAYALVERLRRALGDLGAAEPHALERPALLLEEVENGVCSWASVTSLERADVDVLPWLWSTRAATELDTLARALWGAWDEAGRPDLAGTLLHPSSPVAHLLWPGLPPEWTVHALERSTSAASDILAALLPEQWQAVLGSDILAENAGLARAACGAVSEATAATWLETARDAEIVSRLWTRFPTLLARALVALLEQGRGADAMKLVVGAPASQAKRALVALSEQQDLAAKLTADSRLELSAQLHAHVANRAPEWRLAYELLSRLQRT